MKKKLKKIKRPAKISFTSFVGDLMGCGTIRIVYPYLLLNHYRKKDLMCMSTYSMNYISEPDWYANMTFVQFQRSATQQHLMLIEHFKNVVQKKYQIPVIYEIDDDLFNVPSWNYASIFYNKSKEITKRIISSCDAMVTSTQKLKELYSPYCKKITVIPNHLPKFVWGDRYPKHEYYKDEDKIKILWAGSQNHFAMSEVVGKDNKGGDFGEGLMNFIRKTTDKYDWHLMGAMPEELRDIKNKINFHPWENVFNYPGKLKDIEPDIMLAPLQNIEFNKSKSNIKALEAVATGAVGVYSDVTPYKFMTLKAKTDEEFISNIEKLAGDIDYRAKIYNKDYQRVKSQLWWESNNNIVRYIESYLGLFGKCL